MVVLWMGSQRTVHWCLPGERFGVCTDLLANFVAGDLVMLGYWNKPELTRQVIKNNLFGERRVYFTGGLFKRDNQPFLRKESNNASNPSRSGTRATTSPTCTAASSNGVRATST